MSHIKIKHIILIICCASFCAMAAERFPIVGSYGFDWLNPTKTRCIKIDSKLSAKFHRCDYSRNHSFGLDYDAYSCKISSRSEYIILKTKEQCQEAFETMQANAE